MACASIILTVYTILRNISNVCDHSITAVTCKFDSGRADNKANHCGQYVAIEKILTGPEQLRPDWAVCGTTGYEFANLVNGLFIDSAADMRMERIYRNFIGDEIDYTRSSLSL